MNVDHPTLNTISLCSGVGMLDEGFHAGFGHMGIRSRTVLYAEREAYPVAVLESRMEEGSICPAPVWFGDFTELPAGQFRGLVDCVVAGFPCQDLSVAGKRAGLDGKRSGLFYEVVRIATDSGAWLMVLENVGGIASATASVVDEAEGELFERAAARVVGELADLGWDAEWMHLSASEVGASHGRERWFCIAWRDVADAKGRGSQRQRIERAWRAEVEGAGESLDDSTSARYDGTRFWANSNIEGRKCVLGTGCEAMGNTRLQHQQLQQCQDGAEHTGAGQPVEHAECARRAQAGSGHEINAGREPEPGCCVLADSKRNGRHQGRAESGREQGRHDASECCCAVADASEPRLQGHQQSSTHEQDGRTDRARTMPINYRILS